MDCRASLDMQSPYAGAVGAQGTSHADSRTSGLGTAAHEASSAGEELEPRGSGWQMSARVGALWGKGSSTNGANTPRQPDDVHVRLADGDGKQEDTITAPRKSSAVAALPGGVGSPGKAGAGGLSPTAAQALRHGGDGAVPLGVVAAVRSAGAPRVVRDALQAAWHLADSPEPGAGGQAVSGMEPPFKIWSGLRVRCGVASGLEEPPGHRCGGEPAWGAARHARARLSESWSLASPGRPTRRINVQALAS